MKNTIRAIAALSVLFAAPAFAQVIVSDSAIAPQETGAWNLVLREDRTPFVVMPYATKSACLAAGTAFYQEMRTYKAFVACSDPATGETIRLAEPN